MNDDCIFCKIGSGDVPSAKVYETASVLAFLDASPVEKGHTLVISKRMHSNGLIDTPGDVLDELIDAARKVALGMMDLGFGGYNVVQNNFPAAGQTVPHLHLHVIPRPAGGNGPLEWRSGARPYASDAERDDFARRLREAIARRS